MSEQPPTEDVEMYDATDDDAYCEGDPTLDDVDPDELQRLADAMDEVRAAPEGDERNMMALGLLHKMYGGELVVL